MRYKGYHDASNIDGKHLRGSKLKQMLFDILVKKRDIKAAYRLFGLPNLPPNTLKVLDIGCGNGFTLEMLSTLSPQLETYGVDIVATNDLPKSVIFYRLDVEKEDLPFADESFDFVICRGVIEHVSNPMNIFNEAFRVLRKGGKFHVLTENWTSIFVPPTSERFTSHTTNFFDDYTHIRPYTKKSLTRMFKAAGFSDVEVWVERNMFLLFLMPVFWVLQIASKFDFGRLNYEVFGADLIGEAYKK